MPICITCSTPVKHLYTTYSKADDRALGKGVRLTQCPHCKRFADKYVEHDFVVLFIDLVLIKPQVYRHLLFNRLSSPVSSTSLDPSILRLGTLLILFDVYLTWARIEKANADGLLSPPSRTLSSAPILVQYLFFLTLNTLATFAHHAIVRGLVWAMYRGGVTATDKRDSGTWSSASGEDKENQKEDGAPVRSSQQQQQQTGRPATASPSAISTALLVSSCTKLFPILLVIWPTDTPSTTPPSGLTRTSFANRARSYVGWAVLVNNLEALLILLDCGYAQATGLAFSGVLTRWAIERGMLGLVGLEVEGGPVEDLIGMVRWVGESRWWKHQVATRHLSTHRSTPPNRTAAESPANQQSTSKKQNSLRSMETSQEQGEITPSIVEKEGQQQQQQQQEEPLPEIRVSNPPTSTPPQTGDCPSEFADAEQERGRKTTKTKTRIDKTRLQVPENTFRNPEKKKAGLGKRKNQSQSQTRSGGEDWENGQSEQQEGDGGGDDRPLRRRRSLRVLECVMGGKGREV
ncbi:MAG: hypothetical protein Q9227_008671 [Pyrenula ochraceoflavens]